MRSYRMAVSWLELQLKLGKMKFENVSISTMADNREKVLHITRNIVLKTLKKGYREQILLFMKGAFDGRRVSQLDTSDCILLYKFCRKLR